MVGNLITANFYVCDCCQMVEAAFSEDASSSKEHIGVDLFVTSVSVSGSSDGEEMHPMEVTSTPCGSAEGDEDEDEDLAIVNIEGMAFDAVEAIIHIDQIFDVLHSLRPVNEKNRERSRFSITTYGFECICEDCLCSR